MFVRLLAEQLEHALLRLIGQRQRGDRDRLAGRQRLAVGRLDVGVGQGQVGRTGLQHVDQVLVEVLTNLHDGQVRTKARRFRTQRARRRVQIGQHLVGGSVVDEIGTAGQRGEAETLGVVGHAGDAQVRLAGLVEHQLELVAVQEVDAVERGVLRGRVDLRKDVVVLADQVRTRGLGNRVLDGAGSRRERQGRGQRAADRTTRGARTDGRGRVVVGGRDRQQAVGVDRRRQVVGLKLRVELIERLDRAVGTVAEGDVDRRAAVEGGEGQGLAGEAADAGGARGGEGARGPGVAGKAKRVQRAAGAGDRQVGIDAGRDLELTRGIDRRVGLAGRSRNRRGAVGIDRRGLHATGKVDRLEHVVDRAGLQIDRRVAIAVGEDVTARTITARNARSTGRARDRRVLEGDDVTVDVQRRTVGDRRPQRGRARGPVDVDGGVAAAYGRRQGESLEQVGLAGDAEIRTRRALQRDGAAYSGRDGSTWLAGAHGDRGSTRGDGYRLDAAGEIDGRQQVVDGRSRGTRSAEIDGGVVAAVGDEIAADARAGRNRGRGRSRAAAEGDGLAVHGQRVAVGGLGVAGQAGGGGAVGGDQGDGAIQRRGAGRASRCAGAGKGANGSAERRAAARRRRAAGRAAIHNVAARGRAGEARGAAQIGRRRTRDGGGDVGLGGVADGGLQRLVGDRLRRVDQLLQRGDAGVGGLQHLHAVGDAIEQIVDVAGAVVERLCREEVGGIVQSRIDALAGRQTVLRGGEKISGGLEGEEVLTNRGGENDTGHWVLPFW